MLYRRTERFRKAFKALPASVQEKAIKAFQLLTENSRHPSLRVKQIRGVENIWEARVDLQYRFTFHYESENDDTILVFRNIDSHDDCLKNP